MVQVAIMIFGASAIWFVSQKSEWKRWGYILGLLGQPFWIYESYTNEQWGILIMTLFYAYSWSQGIWNYWLFPKTPEKTDELKALNEYLRTRALKIEGVQAANSNQAFPLWVNIYDIEAVLSMYQKGELMDFLKEMDSIGYNKFVNPSDDYDFPDIPPSEPSAHF